MSENTRIVLASRPSGAPTGENWEIRTSAIPVAGPGQVVIKVGFISIDPAMRGWLDDRPSYLPPVEVGAVMRAGGVGTVVESQNPAWSPGAVVQGMVGVQHYALSDGSDLESVDTKLGTPSEYLGVLGSTGLTAYFGLLSHGTPQAGDTVVVSAAAGAVGSIVGQIAKISGCRVVGIAGSDDKCDIVRGLGFHECINYKTEDVRSRLRELCPRGIDVYFDNVGGSILEASLANLARGARVVICGAISRYNDTEASPGPRNYMNLLVQRASMTGFLVFDHVKEYRKARRRLAQWKQDGQISAPETIVEGSISAFPAVFSRLFDGDNVGKLILAL